MPTALNLPNPRHAERVPAHIDRDDLARIRQAAYALPQVIKPADYGIENGARPEEQLDHLGLVLLQKAVTGARPSRWIDPLLMDSALAHLDSVGTGPGVRPLMLERGAALEGLGLTRHGGIWTRLASQALVLDEAGWQIPVKFRWPVAPARRITRTRAMTMARREDAMEANMIGVLSLGLEIGRYAAKRQG